jgi:hypothetical protein
MVAGIVAVAAGTAVAVIVGAVVAAGATRAGAAVVAAGRAVATGAAFAPPDVQPDAKMASTAKAVPNLANLRVIIFDSLVLSTGVIGNGSRAG